MLHIAEYHSIRRRLFENIRDAIIKNIVNRLLVELVYFESEIYKRDILRYSMVKGTNFSCFINNGQT